MPSSLSQRAQPRVKYPVDVRLLAPALDRSTGGSWPVAQSERVGDPGRGAWADGGGDARAVRDPAARRDAAADRRGGPAAAAAVLVVGGGAGHPLRRAGPGVGDPAAQPGQARGEPEPPRARALRRADGHAAQPGGADRRRAQAVDGAALPAPGVDGGHRLRVGGLARVERRDRARRPHRATQPGRRAPADSRRPAGQAPERHARARR